MKANGRSRLEKGLNLACALRCRRPGRCIEAGYRRSSRRTARTASMPAVL
ncbi:hypothetical protein APY03_4531 [Variovorax sp. WDL1]|nr:hypothetical protein APY03_4531 [Variovorax sp. WDL1]